MKRKTLHFLILTLLGLVLWSSAFGAYTPPANNRVKYNLNYDWKFNKADVANSSTTAFSDAAWQTVSLPHTYNDADMFDTYITGSGNYGWAGKTWYRKHFKLDASQAGRRVILELEGVRQAAEVYINGTKVGIHENGVGPAGFDLTDFIVFGATENVLAIKIDNTLGYKEVATGETFVWNTPPFHPNFGGIVSNVSLHVMDKLYQTLPLYSNLGTTGTYIYANNINIGGASADVNVEAQVKNSNASTTTADFTVVIVDRSGNQVATQTVAANAFAAGETKTIKLTIPLTSVKFWSPDAPSLYKAYGQLKVGANTLDVNEISFGVRKLDFNVADGLSINGRFLYLKGYAPRSTMEWVAIDIAPNWLNEWDMKLMKESNANFIRPMHVSPRKRDVESADKLGIIYACPAGDAEGDNIGRQWDIRVELMRDVTIYYRNNPSVVFWEGGNQHITPAHMQEIVDVRKLYDPNGGRYSGTRSIDTDLTGIAEYGSTMDGVGTLADRPVWDAEYAREECPRRVWDKYSPPSFGYKNIAYDVPASNLIVEYPVNDFKLNSSEDLARSNAMKYYKRWSQRGGQGLNSIMVGGAKIIFADGISHGRMNKTELCRVTGSTDAARLPKEAFFALKAAQSDTSELEILGHWTYPAATVKSVYVISNMDEIRLATYDINGALIKDYGKGVKGGNNSGFEFAFDNVAWMPGKIVATGYNGGVAIKSKEIKSAGAATQLKLTPIIGPDGIYADGSDVAMFDIEVLDAAGVRVPTQESVVTFTYSGQATFLGGYNSGIEGSTYKNYINTECGVNRVFVRSTRTAGAFTLNATSPGLTSTSSTITTKTWTLTDGLTTTKTQAYTPKNNDLPIEAIFSFTDVVGAELNTLTTSALATVSGLTGTMAIKILNSTSPAVYSINGGAFTANDGVVSNGDQIRVQITSDPLYSTLRSATIQIGTKTDAFSVTTKVAPIVPPGGANLALNKPITVSTFQGAFVAKNLNDGQTATRWSAATAVYPQSAVVDLGHAYMVDSTEICPTSARDYKYTLEGSLDSITFFPLADRTNNTIAALSIPAKFPAQSIRYIRLTITGATTYTGGWTAISEFKVFELKSDKDLTPDQFTIMDQTNAPLFSSRTSAPFTVTGIDGDAPISISNNNEIASYSINGGAFTTDARTVKNNDVVRVQLGTGSVYNNLYKVTVTIGGVSEDFTITTSLIDIAPNQFTIIDQTNVLILSSGTSEPFTVTGIDGDAPISLSNNNEITSYSINGGQFITTASTVKNNDVVRIQLATGSLYNNLYTVTVTIGGVKENFTITTALATALNESQNSPLDFYPNPTSDVINVSGIQEVGTVQVFNLAGLLVKSIVVSESSQVDLSLLQRGVYIIKISTGAKMMNGQLILK